MPGYRGHLVGGMVFFFVALAFVAHWCTPTLLTILEWGGCTLAGALFPDIDTKSKGQRFFYQLLLIIFAVLLFLQRYKALAFTSIVAFVPLIVHHRGLCHRVWFVLLIPFSAALLLATLMPDCTRILMFDAAFFSLGALSHLWFDMGLRAIMRW